MVHVLFCCDRAGMDGSNPTKIFKKPVVQWPNGLSIDFVANRIYWVDAQKDFIASADLDGNDFKTVLSKDPNVKHPFAVGIHKVLRSAHCSSYLE